MQKKCISLWKEDIIYFIITDYLYSIVLKSSGLTHGIGELGISLKRHFHKYWKIYKITSYIFINEKENLSKTNNGRYLPK